ncbi:hypothetical protein [Catenuloplanes atrovinosus]|uniref:Uncharacterized protein n=1 Tax=Catenuloplanes atrovinosus TaxID=137266 RepID=A0AAE3YP40_9ACTN|nr:hypothetical protein [Catenuloplanes atrovinosus]MDR7276062.1 hypothetical protein [Catenuloplanes atrovinosus]
MTRIANDARTTTLRTLAATDCGTGSCPTVYEGDPGKIVVQGYIVSAADAGITLPAGEMLVEVPRRLLIDALRTIS